MSVNTPNLTNLKTLDSSGHHVVTMNNHEERELWLKEPRPSRLSAMEWDDNYHMYQDEVEWSRLKYDSRYNHLWLINRLGGIKDKDLEDQEWVDKMHDHSDIISANSSKVLADAGAGRAKIIDEQVNMAAIKIYDYLNAHYMGAFEYEDGIWTNCIAKAKAAKNICQYSFKLNKHDWIEVVDWSTCGDLHVKRDIEYLYYSSLLNMYRKGDWLKQSKNDMSTFTRTVLEARMSRGLTAGNQNTLREGAEYHGSGLKGWINLRVGYAWFIRNYGDYINYKDEHKWLTKILNQVRELK